MLTRRKHPMPEMATFVAELRAAFGDSVDEAVSRGKNGEPTFYARENGARLERRQPTTTTCGRRPRTCATVTIATGVTEVASEPRSDAVSA
jgi:hypothetical protein